MRENEGNCRVLLVCLALVGMVFQIGSAKAADSTACEYKNHYGRVLTRVANICRGGETSSSMSQEGACGTRHFAGHLFVLAYNYCTKPTSPSEEDSVLYRGRGRAACLADCQNEVCATGSTIQRETCINETSKSCSGFCDMFEYLASERIY